VRVLLAADVLIGALDADDAHHASARKWFADWVRDGTDRLISVVNLTEVLIAPAADPGRLARAREAIAALGVRAREPTEAIAVDAARLRSRHRVSIPDSYLLATARATGATIASFDRTVIQAADEESLPHL
jgi:predicted nucleic acid-binding protein